MSATTLKEKLTEISKQVEPEIRVLLTRNIDKGNVEAVNHQCQSGGKRIRPALVVLSGQVFGADIKDLLKPAAAIEIMHNSTLIVDDIIDHSEFRRDEPTSWKKYGKSIAECLAFAHLASVFEGLGGLKNSSKLIDLYSQTLKTIINGEILDILFERSGRDDEDFVVRNRYKVIGKDNYLEMIGKKTANLLQACCKAGAICADASDDQVEAMGSFGRDLGMAFQFRDDTLDIFGDEKEFGKKIGKDIIEKKMGNFVILTALEQLKGDDKGYVIDLLNRQDEISDEDVKKVTELIEKTSARQIAEETANRYIETALKSLSRLPKNKYSKTLAEVAGYIVDRKC